MKFKLGRIVITSNIASCMKENCKFNKEIIECLEKYKLCNWGKTVEGDKEINDNAVKYGEDSILAVYNTCKGDIWILTEWDRSFTTILFPSEY